MDNRKLACGIAAAFIGVALTAASTAAFAKPRTPIEIVAPKIDPQLQRSVSYADLNLSVRSDQRTLNGRIYRTATDLCFDLNGNNEVQACTSDAVRSTDDQVAAAVYRAQRQMAGLPMGPAVAISMVIGAR